MQIGFLALFELCTVCLAALGLAGVVFDSVIIPQFSSEARHMGSIVGTTAVKRSLVRQNVARRRFASF